jgi:uncharacterized protein DUF5666/carboxypeptidase-like protein
MTAPPRRLLPVLIICLLAVACGSSSPKSPTAPETGGPAAEPPSTTGATILGLVSSGSASASAITMGASGMSGVTVSVGGTGIGATTNSTGHFTLSGVPGGLVRLQFSGGGANGEVQIEDVGDHETIEIEVHPAGGGMEIESEERENGAESQLEGRIASINGGAHTFVIGDTTVSVPGTASITDGFRGLDFTDLVVGARVHVKGSKSGSTITATRIEVQQSNLEKAEAHGSATDLGGACPDLTFRIGSQAVAVNDSTIFVHGGCADVTNGTTVEVKGLRRPDGSILATNLKIDDDSHDGGNNGNGDENDDDNGDGQEVEFTGTVSGLGGHCPALTFSAAGKSVTTNGSTSFLTACSSIHDGVKLEVKGKATGNGPVTATSVKAED